MPVPTQGEIFAKLTHHLREAQDCAAILSHLTGLQGNSLRDQAVCRGWLAVSEHLKLLVKRVTIIGMGKMQ